MRPMVTPPTFLDGARVLQFASLGTAQPSGRARHVVNGDEVTRFAAVAIARYDDSSSAHLFYCDRDWQVVTDTEHEDVDAAIQQANFEFGLLHFQQTATAD
jgi:hypothetical protein